MMILTKDSNNSTVSIRKLSFAFLNIVAHEAHNARLINAVLGPYNAKLSYHREATAGQYFVQVHSAETCTSSQTIRITCRGRSIWQILQLLKTGHYLKLGNSLQEVG